jgi:bacillithiol system protein YtxJ
MITEISSESSYQEVIQAQNAILFKHSTSCPTSFSAYREVLLFTQSHPDAQVFIVKVIEQREYSNRLAEHFNVRHASPQIIMIEDGHAVTNLSHHRITCDAIENSI